MMVCTDGTLDKSGKTLTESCEGPDPTNTKLIKYKMLTEFKDDNTIVFNMSFPDDKGKEGTMTITYTRRSSVRGQECATASVLQSSADVRGFGTASAYGSSGTLFGRLSLGSHGRTARILAPSTCRCPT